ncbi:MAG: hypothetical protein ACYDCL_07830 [Myxococcales bacterium]
MTAKQLAAQKHGTDRAVGALAGLLRKRGASREIVLSEASPEVAADQVLLFAVSRDGKVARALRVSGQVDARDLELGLSVASQVVEEQSKHGLPLSSAEAALLRRGGFTKAPPRAFPARAAGAVQFAALLKASLTPEEAASRLSVNSSRIRQRLGARQLYGVKQGRSWRLPAFQFAAEGLVPGIDHVLPALPRTLHPVAVVRWFESPNADLPEGEAEAPLSPRDWLLEGRDPAPVAALAAQL